MALRRQFRPADCFAVAGRGGRRLSLLDLETCWFGRIRTHHRDASFGIGPYVSCLKPITKGIGEPGFSSLLGTSQWLFARSSKILGAYLIFNQRWVWKNEGLAADLSICKSCTGLELCSAQMDAQNTCHQRSALDSANRRF